MNRPEPDAGDHLHKGHAAVQSSLSIVCSDCTRNGKTLFAKLAADLLTLRNGSPPYILDTDNPDGSLIHHFAHFGEEVGRIVDLSRIAEQVALFDGLLGQAGTHFVVDLSARHFKQFFDIYEDIGMEAEALKTGLGVSIYFLLDRSTSSVNAAADLAERFALTAFIPVRNEAIGSALDDQFVAERYAKIRKEREIVLPDLSGEALGMLEHPEFHFDTFVAGRYDHFPFELKAELWGFLEALYEQRESSGDPSVNPI